MSVQIFAHPFSSYCQKVLTALYEKQIPFEYKLLSMDNPATGAELAQLWPLMKFPVARVGERTLLESSIIIEWADRQPTSALPLIPADPELALEVRMRDRLFDNYVMTPMQAIVGDRLRPEASRDAYGVERARDALDKAYRWLDGEMASRTWAAGNSFSMADCAAGPALFYANWVHPLAAYSNLAAYHQRLLARPSFARAVDEARPYRHLFPGGAPTDRG